MFKHLTLRTLLGLAALSFAGQAAALETIREIIQCANGNVPQKTFSQMLGVSAFDRIGVERRLVARMYGQRTEDDTVNLMLGVLQPEDLAGARYLVRGQDKGEDEMYMFLPALNAVRQIRGEASNSKLWGTDFSYVDILQIFGTFAEGRMTRKDNSTLNGRSVYVLDVEPYSEGESPYARIVTKVDAKTCLTSQVEFTERGGKLRKRLTMNTEVISKEDGRFVGHEYTMEDFRDKTQTTLYLGDVIYDEATPRGVFSPQGFRYID